MAGFMTVSPKYQHADNGWGGITKRALSGAIGDAKRIFVALGLKVLKSLIIVVTY